MSHNFAFIAYLWNRSRIWVFITFVDTTWTCVPSSVSWLLMWYPNGPPFCPLSSQSHKTKTVRILIKHKQVVTLLCSKPLKIRNPISLKIKAEVFVVTCYLTSLICLFSPHCVPPVSPSLLFFALPSAYLPFPLPGMLFLQTSALLSPCHWSFSKLTSYCPFLHLFALYCFSPFNIPFILLIYLCLVSCHQNLSRLCENREWAISPVPRLLSGS